jgi:DNA-binding IclR family transcriptional regulator
MTGLTNTRKSPQINFSTGKLLSIIEYLANADEPVRLKTLSEELDINNSTALRFLASLEKDGYVRQEAESKRYFLTMKICTLSHKLLAKNNIIIYAKPFLERLSNLFMEATCLSIEQDMYVIYIATHDGPNNMLKYFHFIGKQAPMHCTGSGKLFLTNYSDAELANYIKKRGSVKPTEKSINTYLELKAELERIKKQDYSIDNEECERGMRCVAIPIRNHTGSIVAGLSVTGPAVRMPFQRIKENLPFLLKVSQQLSFLLGYAEDYR